MTENHNDHTKNMKDHQGKLSQKINTLKGIKDSKEKMNTNKKPEQKIIRTKNSKKDEIKLELKNEECISDKKNEKCISEVKL